MIPLYAAIAGTGKIYSLDDPTVVKDGAALNGSGGTAFVPYAISTSLNVRFALGMNRVRRFMQRVAHDGPATVRVTVIRDGRESVPITRALGIGDAGVVNAPLADGGSDLQIKLELTAYDAPVAFGDSEAYVVNRRSST